MPVGNGKVAFALRPEMGEAIANVLASDGHENKTYILTGSLAYSFGEIAAILSELSGKHVPYVSPEPGRTKHSLKNLVYRPI